MDAMTKIGMALLIVLLLPAVIAEWEGRRLPGLFHAALAVGGLIFSAMTGGATAVGLASLVGIGCLVLLGALVTGVASSWSARPLTGSNIKLLAAGATWLGAGGALLMILLLGLLFVATAVVLRVRNGVVIRPGLSPLFAVIMIGIFLSSPVSRSIAI